GASDVEALVHDARTVVVLAVANLDGVRVHRRVVVVAVGVREGLAPRRVRGAALRLGARGHVAVGVRVEVAVPRRRARDGHARVSVVAGCAVAVVVERVALFGARTDGADARAGHAVHALARALSTRPFWLVLRVERGGIDRGAAREL